MHCLWQKMMIRKKQSQKVCVRKHFNSEDQSQTTNLDEIWTRISIGTKYQRSGVLTRGSSSRQISKLCNLGRVEAKSQN